MAEIYMLRIVPLLGGLISGDRAAYSYLPHSTVAFPPPEELRQIMEQAGLRNAFYQKRMLGTVAIHIGFK
jgi:demethylmenaquinone methyltransferase/2-methoxy-6-polyprenyl-1,4-benzoquinol methylase